MVRPKRFKVGLTSRLRTLEPLTCPYFSKVRLKPKPGFHSDTITLKIILNQKYYIYSLPIIGFIA